jgi:hypothetical protein
LAAPVFVSGAVEGPSDEPVLRRIVEECGGIVHRVQVQNGKPNLRRALPGYNAAARRSPWLVLVDLDQGHPCAGALVTDWLPVPSAHMRLRVVVHQIEAWLLADAERFASFFGVKRSAIPSHPDSILDAKAKVLALVEDSRRSALRQDMLPRAGSGRKVGPAYTSRVIDFASNSSDGWRLDVAMKHSASLAKCVTRLDELIATLRS